MEVLHEHSVTGSDVSPAAKESATIEGGGKTSTSGPVLGLISPTLENAIGSNPTSPLMALKHKTISYSEDCP